MFENVGEKLKVLAMISCWLGIIGSVILGIVVIGENALVGILLMAFGSFSAWISSLSVYGLGEAVEKATEAALNSASQNRRSSAHTISNDEQKLLQKLKVQDQKEEEERKQAQAQERAEAWKKKLAESGGEDWIITFLGEAASCERITEVREKWESLPKEENELTEEIGKKIAASAQVERMYGRNPQSIQRLLGSIRDMVTANGEE